MSNHDKCSIKNLKEEVAAMSVGQGSIAGVTDNEPIVKSTKYKLKNLKRKLKTLNYDTISK